MAVHPPVGLAVARLTELRPAWSHRYHEGRPLEGYCLVSCDPGFSRVTLLVENGRTLTDRSGSGGFYYEGWLVGPAGAVSLGAFNVGPDGRGAASRVIAASQVMQGRAELVRVTVEPFGGTPSGGEAILEGKLVWLEAPAAAPEPTASPSPEAARGPAAPAWNAGPAVGAAGASAAPAAAEARGAAFPSRAEPAVNWANPFTGTSPAAAPEKPVAAGAVGVLTDQPAGAASAPDAAQLGADAAGDRAQTPAPAVLPTAEGGEASSGQDAATDGTAPAVAGPGTPGTPPAADPAFAFPTPGPGSAASDLASASAQAAADAAPGTDTAPPQPAPRHVNPLSLQVPLVQRHPMAPRAVGTATLNLRRGHLLLSLRGLPSPTALGRDSKSGRPFNAYRVWLINQKTQMRTPAGYCERVWGENFRFEADGLPLNRCDTILVTAEDRSVATTAGHPAPQVLIGTYDPRL